MLGKQYRKVNRTSELRRPIPDQETDTDHQHYDDLYSLGFTLQEGHITLF
jgi:hypothetical protein